MATAACLVIAFTLIFTPALAQIQAVYDKIFSSKHIDDTGLKSALMAGKGQTIDQTYYDKEHDITVHFGSIMTDDKETKLLLTYQSKKTNLKNYYVDIFEGQSSVQLVMDNGQEKKLNCVGWGSRYYDSNENKVAEALSFDTIKGYEGRGVQLAIENLTIYKGQDTGTVQTTWPLNFKLEKSGVSDRETIKVSKEFQFKNKTYTIKSVEFSPFETRVVVTGNDTKLITDKDGDRYHVMSELEKQFLNARKISKENGYTVDDKKSGVFLRSAGEKVDPIFSKGEVEGNPDEYLMIFAPVKDRKDVVLEVGKNIKVPLTK